MREDRRGFLKVMAVATGAIATGAVPGCGLNPPPTVTQPGLDAKGAITISPSLIASLSPVGGSVILDIPSVNPVLVMHIDETTFKAVDALCTHYACPVAYDKKNNRIECP